MCCVSELSISNHSKEMPIKLRSEIGHFLPDVLMPGEDESDGGPHHRVMNSVLIILQTGHVQFSHSPGGHQQGQCGSHLHGEDERWERRESSSLIMPAHAKHRPRGSVIMLCKTDSWGRHN